MRIILQQNNLTISRIYKYCVVRNFFKLTSSLIKIFIISLWIYYCGLYKISVSLRICKFTRYIDHAYVSKYKDRELLLYSLRNHFLNAPIREKHPLAIFEYSVLVLLNRVARSESDVYNIRDGVEFMSLAGMPCSSISESKVREKIRFFASRERVEQRGRAIFRPFHPGIRPGLLDFTLIL